MSHSVVLPEDDRARLADLHARLVVVEARMETIRMLLDDLEQPGIGLGGSWRQGMVRYYRRVYLELVADRELLLADIDTIIGAGGE